jgi:hypothetical protein
MATLKVKSPTKPKTHGSSRFLQYKTLITIAFCYRAVLFSVSQTSKKNIRQANAEEEEEEEELRIQRSSTRLPQSKVCHRAVISAISQTS